MSPRRGTLSVLALLLLASPARAAWDRFEIIHWQKRDVAQWTMLRRLGVTAATVIADRGEGVVAPVEQQIAPPRAAGLRWYVENIATDLYASYHRYTPGRDVNWRFVEAQQRYRANPSDPAALMREPSLLDPVARERIRARLTKVVRTQKRDRPLYYSLGDETGIADLTAYWDFDLSPVSIDGFRAWLRGQYGSLAALNAEWGTSYAAWDAIRPEITRETMRRIDDNFAAWNDFKAWMDTSFADALRFGTDAVHRADPAALSAIEGVQTPGWGGFDYTKLARAVDVMEMGDGGEELPLLRAINPRVVPLITSFAASPAETHRVWRAVLLGARGLLLWDDDNSITRPDASPGPRALVYKPLFAALRGPVTQRLMEAQPVYNSVAILYSPVSFRVTWMLDHRPAGDAWMQRSSESELSDNAWRASWREYAAALKRMGLRPRYITPEQLASGPPAVAALILPHAIALSPAEVASVKAFAAKGGKVIADTPPGAFDGHGKRSPAPAVTLPLVPPADLSRALAIAPAWRIEAADNDIDSYVFRSNGRRLLALQRHAAADAPETVTVTTGGARVRDIVSGQDFGRPGRLVITVDGIAPSVLEIGP